MKQFIFTLIFILTVSIEGYSQTTWDTALLGGVNTNQEPIGSMELRLGVPIVKRVWLVGSGKADIIAIPTRKEGLTHSFNLNLYPRTGVRYSLLDKIDITSGVSLMSRPKGWWPYPYLRTDIKVISIEESSIMGVLDIQQDRILIGITFKDIINKI
jgi:hypothetical protein